MDTLNRVEEISVKYTPSLNKPERTRITSSRDSYNEFRKFFDDYTIEVNEQFFVMYLNRAGKILGVYRASTGGITGTVLDIRLVLGVALKSLATSLILAHNHPSGNVHPSRNDQVITAKIKEAAALMDITVMDHLILTQNEGYYSFADEGLI